MAREGLLTGSSNLETLRDQLAATAKDRNDEAKGAKPALVPMLPKTPEDAPANIPTAFRDLMSYYRTPCGLRPRAPNLALPRSWEA